jgi:hypothetical protein
MDGSLVLVTGAERLVRLVRGDADALTGCYLTAYDDLDAILARSDEIAASGLYALGLLEPDPPG